MATFTPAATAFANEAVWISTTSRAFATDAAGIEAPASAASMTPRGATSVGTSHVPRSSISSIASSSR